MLVLPVARATTIVVVHPHYPENVGAAARAMKTMGITGLVLVKPGRLAVPEHEMARKMAVKSLDVLEGAVRCKTVGEALGGVALSFATTSRRGSRRRVAEARAAACYREPRSAASASRSSSATENRPFRRRHRGVHRTTADPDGGRSALHQPGPGGSDHRLQSCSSPAWPRVATHPRDRPAAWLRRTSSISAPTPSLVPRPPCARRWLGRKSATTSTAKTPRYGGSKSASRSSSAKKPLCSFHRERWRIRSPSCSTPDEETR